MKELFVSDLDGTLLNGDKQITPYTAGVINKLAKEGTLFSVATARTAGTVVDMLKDVNINCPVVLMNGSMVFDIREEKYIKYEVIKKDAFLKVCELAKKFSANGFLYVYNGAKLIAYYENITEVSREFYNQRKSSDKYKEFVPTDDFKSCADEKCIYFALMDSYEKLKKVCDGLEDTDVSKAFYKDIYEDGLYYLEVFAKSATKANGVKFLKEYTGAEKVIAFGDNLNDLDMFEVADVSVAVENAVDEVKNKADYICRNNNENGVAEFIEAPGEIWRKNYI